MCFVSYCGPLLSQERTHVKIAAICRPSTRHLPFPSKHLSRPLPSLARYRLSQSLQRPSSHLLLLRPHSLFLSAFSHTPLYLAEAAPRDTHPILGTSPRVLPYVRYPLST